MKSSEKWIFLGANGSGKTSFLRLLYGQLAAYNNQRFNRFGSTSFRTAEFQPRLGFVTAKDHDSFLFDMTVEQYLASARSISSRIEPGLIDQQLNNLGLKHLAGISIFKLSTGEARIINLARALLKEPDLLLLDEPFNGLDKAYRKFLIDWLADYLFVMTTHYADEILPGVTHVGVFADGLLHWQGSYGQFLNQKAALGNLLFSKS